MGKQGEIATKLKQVEVRDTQEREGQRKIKTENTFSVLQEDTEPLREEKKLPQIVKINKDKKKIYKRKGRGRIRKVHRERKGESETRPNTGLPKNYSNKENQNKKSVPLRCKSAKCLLTGGKRKNARTEREKLQSCIKKKRTQMLKKKRRQTRKPSRMSGRRPENIQ